MLRFMDREEKKKKKKLRKIFDKNEGEKYSH